MSELAANRGISPKCDVLPERGPLFAEYFTYRRRNPRQYHIP